MDLEALYKVLVTVARGQQQITYGELSRRYHQVTGDWHEPHGSWDEPLGVINRTLHAAALPPLSAVVILQDEQEPGGRFWGSSPGVPGRPPNEVARVATYSRILGSVLGASWPGAMP